MVLQKNDHFHNTCSVHNETIFHKSPNHASQRQMNRRPNLRAAPWCWLGDQE